tara:strand:+ start:524 stop:949 length:426 start_codon:yes stop_codon:yes gene_type:complete
MDIAQGLSSASTALTIVKQSRDIDKSVDEATFKLKLADLQSALTDAKVALAEARESQVEKNAEISELKRSLDSLQNGDICPKCYVGRLRLSSSSPHHMYGLNHFGVEKWEMLCNSDECDFQEERLNDPHGILVNTAKQQMR